MNEVKRYELTNVLGSKRMTIELQANVEQLCTDVANLTLGIVGGIGHSIDSTVLEVLKSGINQHVENWINEHNRDFRLARFEINGHLVSITDIWFTVYFSYAIGQLNVNPSATLQKILDSRRVL